MLRLTILKFFLNFLIFGILEGNATTFARQTRYLLRHAVSHEKLVKAPRAPECIPAAQLRCNLFQIQLGMIIKIYLWSQ